MHEIIGPWERGGGGGVGEPGDKKKNTVLSGKIQPTGGAVQHALTFPGSCNCLVCMCRVK